MSYYYEDTSHYCYNEPAYRDSYSEPAYCDDTPSDPVYHEDTPYSDTVTPTPTFFDNIYPEPIYYTDTHLELIYPNDNTTGSPMTAPEPYGIEQESELEAYAEAASNRTYSWDEIHPAYRDQPTNSYCEPTHPRVDYDEYYEDVTDEELAEMNRRCTEYQKQLAERQVEEVKDDDRKECEDDGSNPLPQSTPTTQHDFDNSIITTLPPDTCTPIPLPLSPNIHSKSTHLKSAFLIAALNRREPHYHFGSPFRRRRRPNFRNLTRTNLPPDIRPPKPVPPKPSILVQPPSTYQQPRRPPHTRPRRKHPPARPPTISNPHGIDRRHNALRRISKKNRPHLF